MAQQLVQSLDERPWDEDAGPEWTPGLEARLQRVEQGNYVAADWREAIKRIRDALALRSAE